MNDVWNLDPIYKGFDDPAYTADMTALKELVEKIRSKILSLWAWSNLSRPLQNRPKVTKMKTRFAPFCFS